MARPIRNALQRLELDCGMGIARVGRNAVELTASELKILQVLLRQNRRAGYADLIPRFWDCEPYWQDKFKRSLHVKIHLLRKKLRTIGIDAVFIANYGLLIEDFEPNGQRAGVLHPSTTPVPPQDRPASLSAPMTDADTRRVLDLAGRNFSATAIAAIVRKPYRAVERAMSGRAA